MAPYLSVPNAKEAIEFYKKVFDATIVGHMPFSKEMAGEMNLPENFDYDNSTMHAHISIHGNDVMLSDDFGSSGEKSANVDVILMPDSMKQIEGFFSKSKQHGATVIMDLEKQFWGDYYARIKDPFGIGWQLNYSPKPEEQKKQTSKETTKSSKKTGKSTKKTKKKSKK